MVYFVARMVPFVAKVAQFPWRRVVYFSWLKLVYFILPFTDAEYSEILVRRMVEKVTIHDDRITVEFKSGLAIDVDA